MPATETAVTVWLHPVTCYECGVTFGMTRDYQADRRRKGDTWYCPNGHPQHYAETLEERLRRQLQDRDAALAHARTARDQYRDELGREERRHAATRGQLTKARRRAAHGVCPVPDCRRRPFDNLARHMATKHPDYVTDADHAAGSGPAGAAAGVVRVEGFYGSMRKVASGHGGATRYRCQCGWEGSVSGKAGRAGVHARTCAQAREPWPTKAAGAR